MRYIKKYYNFVFKISVRVTDRIRFYNRCTRIHVATLKFTFLHLYMIKINYRMLIHDVMLKRISLPLSQHRDSRTKMRRAQKIFINLSDARDVLIIRV